MVVMGGGRWRRRNSSEQLPPDFPKTVRTIFRQSPGLLPTLCIARRTLGSIHSIMCEMMSVVT